MARGSQRGCGCLSAPGHPAWYCRGHGGARALSQRHHPLNTCFGVKATLLTGEATWSRHIASAHPGGVAAASRRTTSHVAASPSDSCGATSRVISVQHPQQLQVDSSTLLQRNPVRYAVVGAGLAGMATAWQLLRRSPRDRPVVLDMYDAAGIAAGGSGAAAGLLHPYNPQGKLLWRGEEAMAAALELVAAAETAAAAGAGPVAAAGSEVGQNEATSTTANSISSGVRLPAKEACTRRGESEFVWRTGLVRPAANAKQAADFARAAAAAAAAAATFQAGLPASPATIAVGSSASSSTTLRPLTGEELQELVPGLVVPPLTTGAGKASGAPAAAAAGEGGEGGAAAAGVDGAGGASRRGPNRRARRTAKAASEASASDPGPADSKNGQVAGILIPQGVVLDAGAYLRALWRACEVEAEARGDGSCARLRLQRVTSLKKLGWEQEAETESGVEGRALGQVSSDLAGDTDRQHYDAVVVAAGAAASTIEEVERARLPLQLCQGLTLVMRPGSGTLGSDTPQPPLSPGSNPPRSQRGSIRADGYPAGSPSLLGQPYMAAQGPTQLVVGATKSYGWSPQDALAACLRSEYAQHHQGGCGGELAATPRKGAVQVDDGLVVSSTANMEPAQLEASAEAVEALRLAACGVWAPLDSWQLAAIREGVRALPPRTTHGSLPLLGRLVPGRRWWLVGGLGSRGLVYHGWLGQITADAVLHDSEEHIPNLLTAWRVVTTNSLVFEVP